MKKLLTALCTLVALATASPAPAQEEAKGKKDHSITLNAGTSFVDKALNPRGFVSHDEPSVQPYASLSYSNKDLGTLTVGYWGNIGIADGKNVEQDLIISYSKDVGPVKGTITWANYFMDDLYAEVSLSLGASVFLNPKLFVAYDYEAGSGLYAELSASHQFDLGIAVLGLDAAGVFNHEYCVDSTGVSGVRGDLKLSFPLGGGFSLSPSVTGFLAAHDDFENNWSATLNVDYVFEQEF